MAGLLQNRNGDSDSDSDSIESVTTPVQYSEEVQTPFVESCFLIDLGSLLLRMMVKFFVALSNAIYRPSLGIESMRGISSLIYSAKGSQTERTLHCSDVELPPNTRLSHLQAKRGSSIDFSSSPSSSSSSLLQSICDHINTIEDPFHEARLAGKSETLREVSRLMSGIRLSHLGCENVLQTASTITCQIIAETKNFDIVLFLLPKGSGFPLHNHPDMVVLSYIVSGLMKVIV